MRNQYRSIKTTYTVVMLFLVVIFTTVVSVLWGSLYKSQLCNGTAENANYMIENSNQNFDKMLSDINYRIFSLSFNSEFNRILRDTKPKSPAKLIADRRTMEGLLRYAASDNSSIQDILVVATGENGGESYSSGYYDVVSPEEVSWYYEQAMEKDKVVFITSKGSSRDIMKLTMAFVLHRAAASEALILITVNCNTLLESYSTQQGFEYGYALYDHGTGELILEHNLDVIGLDGNRLDLLSLPRGEGEKKYDIVQLQENNYMLMQYLSPLTDWETFIMVPQANLQSKYMSATFINTIMITLCVILALAAAWWCAGFLARDILKLCAAVEKVDGEHLEISYSVETPNEVGLLGMKFEEMILRLKEQMQIKERDEKEKRQLEIRALQAQINPHFLYNSLSTIKFMAKIQNEDSIMEATDALSNIMRINISAEEYMTMEQEKKYLKSYICLQEYQKSYPIRFACILDENTMQCRIIKLLIQPLVENSIRHGGILERNGLSIEVRAMIKDEKLHIIVRDNGKGIPQEKLLRMTHKFNESGSIGLYNVAERIRLNYGERFGMIIDSREGEYTVVELVLPVMRGEIADA